MIKRIIERHEGNMQLEARDSKNATSGLKSVSQAMNSMSHRIGINQHFIENLCVFLQEKGIMSNKEYKTQILKAKDIEEGEPETK